MAALLSSYPAEVVEAVTDPVRGIAVEPGRHWMPDLADLRQACEVRMEPLRAQARREAQQRATQTLLAAPMVQATVGERDRATQYWFERARPVTVGRPAFLTDEEARAEAERKLESLRTAPLPQRGVRS